MIPKEKNIKTINPFTHKRYFFWRHPEEKGNILLNDLKFLNIIYLNDNSYFESINKVADASDNVKTTLAILSKADKKYRYLLMEKALIHIDSQRQ